MSSRRQPHLRKAKELEPATKKVADILKGGGLKPSKAKE